MSSPSPLVAPSTYPHDELRELDKENVARLLEINTKIQSLFRKHPFFETDPTCRLAREMAVQEIMLSPGSVVTKNRAEAEESADRLVVNGGFDPICPIPLCVNIGPKGKPIDDRGNVVADPKLHTFPDFLVAGNHPRPLWMAWIPQAQSAIAAADKLNERSGDA